MPIEKENLIDLSDNPFISIEDLFTLFEHFEYKMTQHGGNGFLSTKFYTLQDAYNESRGGFSNRDKEINIDLEQIYKKASQDEDGFV